MTLLYQEYWSRRLGMECCHPSTDRFECAQSTRDACQHLTKELTHFAAPSVSARPILHILSLVFISRPIAGASVRPDVSRRHTMKRSAFLREWAAWHCWSTTTPRTTYQDRTKRDRDRQSTRHGLLRGAAAGSSWLSCAKAPCSAILMTIL